MASSRTPSGRGFGPDQGPLDAVAAAFGWLVEGPDPLAVDGRDFAGLPDRPVGLGELRERLLDPGCRPATRDAVWAHLVTRARREGEAWTIGCVGMALPALLHIAATLTARFAGDPRDVHAATLTGFLAALAEVDLDRPRIMLRLRWAAYRAGHAALREALDAPTPIGDDHPGTPVLTAQEGHPDLVLARAVADGVLSVDEAELIGATRWDGETLAAAAQRRRAGYEATKKARRRAELRLAAYLHELASDPGTPDPQPGRPDARASTTPKGRSRSVTGRRARRPRRLSPDDPAHGVQERRERHTTHRTASPPPGPPTGTDAQTSARSDMGSTTPPTGGDSGGVTMRLIPSRRPATRVLAEDAVRSLARAITIAAATVVFAISTGALAHAAELVAAPVGSIDQVLSNLRAWLVGILAGLATVFLTLGGVRYVMANGDPGEIEKAKSAFRGAGIGYALAVLAPLVVSVLQGIVGG